MLHNDRDALVAYYESERKSISSEKEKRKTRVAAANDKPSKIE